MKSLEELGKEALQLPVASRVLLAEQLLDSLGQPDQRRVEALWSAEIAARLARYDRGETAGVPAAEVFARLRARHRQ